MSTPAPHAAFGPPAPRGSAVVVHEIYASIQGESTRAGRPCVFVRFTGCDLRCGYCDTTYAFHHGQKRGIEEILAEIAREKKES